jgi:EpsI family protein
MMHKLRAYAPAVVLLAGCAFMLNARSQRAVPLAGRLAQVLADVPGYRVENQQLSAEERRVAGMTDYVARVFWRDSTPAFTTFVSYYDRQTQGATIHSPRNCLPGAGWEIISAGTATLTVDGSLFEVNRNVLKNKGSTAVVYYWYQGRGRIVASEYRVKWNLLRDASIAGHTEESLVRVVVPVTGSGTPEASIADARDLGAGISARIAHELWQVLPRA